MQGKDAIINEHQISVTTTGQSPSHSVWSWPCNTLFHNDGTEGKDTKDQAPVEEYQGEYE